MATILLAISGWEPDAWLSRFRTFGQQHTVRTVAEIGDPAEIDYVCAWKPPSGLLAKLPNLKVIFSLGAGVDHLMNDPSLPSVPIVRIVDPDLTKRMCEYVVLHCLLHQRKMKLYGEQQSRKIWHEHPERPAGEVRVGILGMGVLGQAAAAALAPVGFKITGWSRSKKTVPGVVTFGGEAELPAFLGQTDILVSLLPLTPATRGMLNYAFFRQLARDGVLGGPALVNAGRGGLQVEADILRALDDGTLLGASLDVFEREPLPQDSPLWPHPKIYVTPHNAAQSDPEALTKYVLGQIEDFERGKPLRNVVDRKLGY
jgi:glyoxylate/hydroxypyruvate reductase A